MKKDLITIIIILLFFICCLYGIAYKCSHNENYLYYGNDEYCFVIVKVGSGRSQDLYYGVITTDDYDKWCNGDDGTIFVYNIKSECSGNRIRVDKITSIKNLGSKPEWLPMNFWL